MTTNNLRIGIAVSSFNPDITENLLVGVNSVFGAKYIELINNWEKKVKDRVRSEAGQKIRNYGEGPGYTQLRIDVSKKVAGEEHGIREAAFKFKGFTDLTGVLPFEISRVPGSFELPLTAQWLVNDGVDAVIALGALIKGDTPHFAYISSAVSQGLMDVSIKHNIPVGFGVITADTLEQALQRADMDFMQSSQENKQQEGETSQEQQGL